MKTQKKMSNKISKKNTKIDNNDIEKKQQSHNKKRKTARRILLNKSVPNSSLRMRYIKERYGERANEIDRDQFFENCSTSNNSETTGLLFNENECDVKNVINVSNYHESSNSNDICFQKSILAKLDEILVRVSCIEKNIAKNDIRLKDIEATCVANSNNTIEVQKIDDYELNRLELPVSSKESLNELEEKLKDKEFKLKMVTFRFNIIH